jgi:hypothetical protein
LPSALDMLFQLLEKIKAEYLLNGRLMYASLDLQRIGLEKKGRKKKNNSYKNMDVVLVKTGRT